MTDVAVGLEIEDFRTAFLRLHPELNASFPQTLEDVPAADRSWLSRLLTVVIDLYEAERGSAYGPSGHEARASA